MSGPTRPVWRVEVSERAVKQIARLPKPERERILQALRQLQDGPYEQNVERLEGRPEWRLRVGGWRVILRVDRQARTIVAVTMGSRGDVYKS